MKKLISFLLIIAILSLMALSFAQETKFQYVGASKCKMCHKGEKKGNVFEKWEASKHAQAFATLAKVESITIAKEKGVKGDPSQAPECLVCHVTGYSAAADQKAETLTLEEGVSCEACHGPGSEYKGLKVMKDIYAGTAKGADYGLIEPNEKVCLTCHNPKSPTYKEFKFDVMSKEIAHPVPKSTSAQ